MQNFSHLSFFSLPFIAVVLFVNTAAAIHTPDASSAPLSLAPGWNNMGVVANGGVYGITTLGSDVYIAGDFTDAGGNASADRVARWDGVQWNALGSGLNGPVYSIATFNGDIFVGGAFTDAGGNVDADHIARWDGVNWNAVGGGLNNLVLAICFRDSMLYAGGSFTNAGGNANADHIAWWDGSQWLALGTGVSGIVYSIDTLLGGVVAGGIFQNAGGDGNADNIARWDGVSWHALGPGLNSAIFKIVSDGTHVYAGGLFSDAGGNVDGDKIAEWDGTNWNPLGTGLNAEAYAIVVEDSNVYVGGAFQDAGGNVQADHVAYWDGSCWQALGNGVNNYVDALALDGPNVFVGGTFTMAGGGSGNDRIARWDRSEDCHDCDPCTIDVFMDGQCQFIPLNCDDGNPCTEDYCDNGVCFHIALPDSDNDGTCDAQDGCPNDPNKTDPGSCGCGNPEPGTPCDDGNPFTVGDTIGVDCLCEGAPVTCGQNGDCSDGDPCTLDSCSNGICISIPLPDSDNDGTCDAQDGCPNDPNKIDPGTCGCGNPEPGAPCDDGDVCTTGDVIDSNCNCTGTLVDSDNDGTCDAQDGCPNDPNKIDPGTCGCGNPEPGAPCDDGDVCTTGDVIDSNCNCTGTLVDSDNDGTCDAQDGCPNDPNKIDPGTCGCGNPEPGSPCDDGDVCTTGDVIDSNCNCTGTLVDSDNDGTCDAQDGCPNDPNKTDPGTCGCGNPEPGTPCDDGDVCTTGDVIDSNCNCTGTLVDSDNDGTCDAQDGCPNDPNKTDPGSCGCGNPEPGTPCDDGDPLTIGDTINIDCLCAGIPVSCVDDSNCEDGDPCTDDFCDGGVCTHVPLPDTDNDGTCDAQDGCPNDPNKIDPGTCGCGNPEPGSPCNDGDVCTVNDVIDSNCNCTGILLDSDNDGTCDAQDGCPNDPNKIDPGPAAVEIRARLSLRRW